MLGTQAFADMAFCAGFVHSDPHAGNVLVRPHPGPQRAPHCYVPAFSLSRSCVPTVHLLGIACGGLHITARFVHLAVKRAWKSECPGARRV